MLNKIEEFLRKLNIIFSEQLSELQEIALVVGGLLITSIFSAFLFSKEVTLNLVQNLIWISYLLSVAFIYLRIMSENKKNNKSNKKYYIFFGIGFVVCIVLNIIVQFILRWAFGEKNNWKPRTKKENAGNYL